MIDQLLPLAAALLPILTIIFVLGLSIHKGYTNIRSRYNARVNCWFCSMDTSVPYADRNSWTCPHCDQYNGFTKDGDYNRDMTSQRDCSQISQKSSSHGSSSICANSYYPDLAGPSPALAAMSNNGLCDQCNEAQRLKVDKLSQFEPKNEGKFDQELKVYREQLEQQFRLCSSCERHVNRVLHEKKKMVLGSKFLNFIIKGAALLKQPYINRLATAQRQLKLQRYRYMMIILTAVNIICLICRMPVANKEQFTDILGAALGSAFFYAYSHLLTLVRVLGSLVTGALTEHREWTTKLVLYFSTFGKLLLYSVGLNHQQAQQATFASCFISVYPFVMMALSFLHKINDGLKFTRFTIILLLWSAYAKGISSLAPQIDGITLVLLGSVITFGLLVTNRSNLLRQAATQDDSFHRLCADECISDEETLSMLSQQLSDCSNLSQRSRTVCHSPAPTLLHRSPLVVPPASSMLSLDSLHLSNHQQQQHHHHHHHQQQQQHAWRSNYGGTAAAAPTVVSAASHSHHATIMFQQKQQQPHMMMRQWNSNLANGQQREFTRSAQSLLMPSRLPGGLMGGGRTSGFGGDVSAWLAANQSMNQDVRMQHFTSYEDKQQQQQPQLQQLQTPVLPQQMSRTSSLSSGFESRHEAAGLPLKDYTCSATVPVPAASNYQQPTLQPGDLLRKWIDDTARLPHHIH